MSKKQIITIWSLWITAIILSFVAVYVTFINRGYTEVAFLDVGQGDACFIQTERFSSVLIDGGDTDKGKYVIEPYLRHKSERCLDAIFVSHMHTDHINGILELIDSDIIIKNIYVSEYAETEEGYSRFKAKADDKGIVITPLKGGEAVTIDNTLFKVIEKGNNYTDQNDLSMVLRFECGENSILFTGDITRYAEDDIIDNDHIDADILKVAHHGSRGSSDIDFLERVTAELFVISVGKNNEYNHPSKGAINRLNSFNAPIVRTDYDGTISLIMTDTDIRKIDLSRERTEQNDSYRA